MSQGLMLKENGEVPSALLYCCYRNFCEEHKLERVPELRHGIDPANIRQFLHKFNMSFEQTKAVDIGCIRGIASAPTQQLALDNNESEQLEEMKEQILKDKAAECWDLLSRVRMKLNTADADLIKVDKGNLVLWQGQGSSAGNTIAKQIDKMMECIQRQAFTAFPRPLPDFVHCKVEDLEAYAQINSLQKAICWEAIGLPDINIPNNLDKMSLQELKAVWARMSE
jgi:hypothetical protein